MTEFTLYEYRCTLVRVVDGDTVIVLVDLGFSVYAQHSIRLKNVWAPEMATPEGKAAKQHLVSLMPTDGRLLLRTEKDKMTFNRYVGELFTADGLLSLNELMEEYLI